MLANIISIGTAVPAHCHRQQDILLSMQDFYKTDADDSRKLAYLYRHSSIDRRYSVVPDFSPGPHAAELVDRHQQEKSLQYRMELFDKYALPLSVEAIHQCLHGHISAKEITHLITVSCTGMSAPGLDLQIAEALELRPDIFRTSVNFMGCYAAIHALKLAKMICDSTPGSHVLIVCTEICTIHFQQTFNPDTAASALLFGDGSAAVLVSNQLKGSHTLRIQSFYAEVAHQGKTDMSWRLSDQGFLMQLSAYIPDLIQQDIQALVSRALAHAGITPSQITHWCLHPGGKKIIDVIEKQLRLTPADTSFSREVLWEYGNMSSPTLLFVLKKIMARQSPTPQQVLGVAFGPGLTMETFIAGSI